MNDKLVTEMKKLTHIDDSGKANMVDVGNKPGQERQAVASGFISLQPETVALITENKIKKGDVLVIAEIAGIQAAKQTSSLIPLCHTLQLTKVQVTCQLEEKGVKAICIAKCIGKTGVEMEALTGVSVTLLTIYDMCKAVDRQMEIGQVKLIEKIKT